MNVLPNLAKGLADVIKLKDFQERDYLQLSEWVQSDHMDPFPGMGRNCKRQGSGFSLRASKKEYSLGDTLILAQWNLHWIVSSVQLDNTFVLF